MDKVCEISLLLDFYGQLLTERQYEVLDLHYNSDYSLGEIAEYLSITRQGVYDNIKRGKAQLTQFEEKLGLVGKFSAQRENAKEVLEKVRALDKEGMSKELQECLSEVEAGILGIVNSF